jgi:hypothetical protein
MALQTRKGPQACPSGFPPTTVEYESRRNESEESRAVHIFLDIVVQAQLARGEVWELMVIAVNDERFRELLVVAEAIEERQSGWKTFLCYLKACVLAGVRLFVSDVSKI